MLPTVFRRARGWISAWERTGVWARNRSITPRTNGRMPAEATSTGASPSCAASSKRCRTRVMNSVSLEGCMARLRSSPWPTIDSANACSLCAERNERQIAGRRGVLGAELAREPPPHVLGQRRRVAAERDALGDPFQDGGEIADRD